MASALEKKRFMDIMGNKSGFHEKDVLFS